MECFEDRPPRRALRPDRLIAPWASDETNLRTLKQYCDPMLGLVSFGMMHLVCIGMGILGLLGLLVAYLVQ